MQTAVSFREDDSEWSFRFPYTYINRDFPAFWRLPCPSPTVLTVTWTPRWCCVWDTRRAKGVMTLTGEIKGTVVSLILGINCHIVIFLLVPFILLIFGGLFSQRCWFSYTLSIFPTNDGREEVVFASSPKARRAGLGGSLPWCFWGYRRNYPPGN